MTNSDHQAKYGTMSLILFCQFDLVGISSTALFYLCAFILWIHTLAFSDIANRMDDNFFFT